MQKGKRVAPRVNQGTGFRTGGAVVYSPSSTPPPPLPGLALVGLCILHPWAVMFYCGVMSGGGLVVVPPVFSCFVCLFLCLCGSPPTAQVPAVSSTTMIN